MKNTWTQTELDSKRKEYRDKIKALNRSIEELKAEKDIATVCLMDLNRLTDGQVKFDYPDD